METLPKDYEQIEDVMSNFDHEIESWAEDKLKSGKFYGNYAARNFHGEVWFDGNNFKCQIKQYRVHVDTIVADSLQDIMKEASDKYGYK